MARPQKQGLDYFPHDTFTDDKIEAMEAKYGLAGHAFYSKLCERIYRTTDGELDVSDAETTQILARNFHISLRHFNAMLETAINKGLFDRQLFEKTKRDPSWAPELVAELRRWSLFHEYQDRFLSLFRKR